MSRRIVIGVGIANYPTAAAGNSWAFLQWALGFQAAGWEVWLVEELSSAKCTDEKKQPCAFDSSVNLSYWKHFLSQFQLLEKATLLVDGEAKNKKELLQFARSSDLFLNISGHFRNKEILACPKQRIYLDLDPAFTQIWKEVYGSDVNLEGHDFFVSVGTRLGAKDCPVPTLGKKWIPTFPPVDLNYWKNETGIAEPKTWTTVTHWYGYPAIQYQDEWYGNKSEEFEKIGELPSKVSESLEIASDLPIDHEVYKKFTDAGWKISFSAPISENWQNYRRYLAESRGEFCVAKNGYVRSRCGWFSDRSVCYLALGRPVILQDTGWNENLPCKEGLFTFKNTEEAALAIQKVSQNYSQHSRAARRLAEEYFSAPVVVKRLLTHILP